MIGQMISLAFALLGAAAVYGTPRQVADLERCSTTPRGVGGYSAPPPLSSALAKLVERI